MTPALEPGDFLVAVRGRAVRRGALVVVVHPGRPGFEMVKRVAARPGEVVEDARLGDDEYWVLGDNQDESTDSRTFGPVPAQAVRGVAVLRYWPPQRFGPLTCGPGPPGVRPTPPKGVGPQPPHAIVRRGRTRRRIGRRRLS